MNAIRAQIEKLSKSTNPLLRAGYRGIKALGAMRRFVQSPRIRSQVLTRLRYQDLQFQGESFSCEDRYPLLFEECKKRLAGLPAPSILSFGCATGEEVFSLAKYLPQARIIGVDINRWCLKQSASKSSSNRQRFIHPMSQEFAELTGLDAIFCMAVFQRTEHRTESARPTDTGFTFERFDSEVSLLDKKLKPCGLFFLDECDFSFEQTAAAAHYEPLEFEGNRVLRQRPLFGRDNRPITSEYSSVRCFIKQVA